MRDRDGDGHRPPDDGEEDIYAIFLRVTGWVYLAVGAAMLAFFLLWLRGR